MPSIKPIKLYSHATDPNPRKVVIILKELDLPYESEFIDFALIKQKPYTNINANGHVPAITDPNTGITLWESTAIIGYLIISYDKEGNLTYRQGPYYGQAEWFTHVPPEKPPSARERYVKAVERVVGVLNSALEGKQWLVGDKCTCADLVFVTWGAIATSFLERKRLI